MLLVQFCNTMPFWTYWSSYLSYKKDTFPLALVLQFDRWAMWSGLRAQCVALLLCCLFLPTNLLLLFNFTLIFSLVPRWLFPPFPSSDYVAWLLLLPCHNPIMVLTIFLRPVLHFLKIFSSAPHFIRFENTLSCKDPWWLLDILWQHTFSAVFPTMTD